MSDSIDRQKVLATLDFADKALDEERTVEKYKELLAECVKALPSAENKGDSISKSEVLDAISRIGLLKSGTKEVQAVAECLRAVEDLSSAENKGDLISRERLINEWDDLGRRYAMPTTPIHKRAFREFPSADMRGE